MTKYQQQDSVLTRPTTDTYQAAVINNPKSIEYVELTTPQLEKDQLLVKMEGVGLCASNIPVWEGREWFDYPMEPGTPGHEGWGVIEQTGSEVSHFKPGQRVAILQGNAFAEYVAVPASDCVLIPEQLAGVPFPGEPFGCMMNIAERADIREGQTVAIIGLGFLGLGLVKLAKEKGARVLALSRRDSSLEMAADDADRCIKMDDHYKIIETIQQLTDGKGCDRVIECTGKQWPLDLGTEIIGYYGKFIIAGYHQDDLRKVNMQQWNWKAIDVINAHERDPEKYKSGIRHAIKAIEEGRLDPHKLLTHQFDFNELPEAFNLLADCPEGFIKGYIKFK
ncbi:zinc-binding dehydrogenase [Fulvivirga kasyanovii]|uniref:L-iditol 2-dehydrogenase n=1 Tax=Fulvivirga kasyanovii TaxID=396812 RepID=A0ABW9S0L5_9BACT|nr:zinc-binding dehydrogenase [Fulvivirga kasyanovii]MTI29070.1 L-iditol 2-dehydrogenase [Fulvivirga kasyanovii]